MMHRVSGSTTSHTEHSRAAVICGKVARRGKDRDGRRVVDIPAWLCEKQGPALSGLAESI